MAGLTIPKIKTLPELALKLTTMSKPLVYRQ